MTNINAKDVYFKELNEMVRAAQDGVVIEHCLGQRYIGCGLADKTIDIHGTAGKGLGAYLNGAKLTVYGNAQDATGDTMNKGEIIIHGYAGDACGYAMRGGSIFVRDDAGYRAGIHMKAYLHKFPKLVIGGSAGSFLGEYQAGGIILVLNRGNESIPVGNFCGTGMHGGKIILRTNTLPPNLPKQVCAEKAQAADMEEIEPLIAHYCEIFEVDRAAFDGDYYVLTPNTLSPYKQLYTHN